MNDTTLVLGDDDVATALRLLYDLDATAPQELRIALRRLILLTAAHETLTERVAALEEQSVALLAWIDRARQAIEALPRPFRSMIPELPSIGV